MKRLQRRQKSIISSSWRVRYVINLQSPKKVKKLNEKKSCMEGSSSSTATRLSWLSNRSRERACDSSRVCLKTTPAPNAIADEQRHYRDEKVKTQPVWPLSRLGQCSSYSA